MEIKYESELCHYGVLGMKWGQHRARKNGSTYTYKSHGTKKYLRKSDKYKHKSEEYKDDKEKSREYSKKSKEFKQKYERSKVLDSKVQKVAKNMTTGETVASVLLAGPFATKSIALGRAKGRSYVESGAIGLATRWITGPLGNVVLNAVHRIDYVGNNKYK